MSSLPPAPFGPIPSARQLKWHQRETYAFIHFSVNTFTDLEWGYGDESPASFAPTAFSAEQIVRTVREAGMQGLILTAKHHDGFCLWPSAHTEHCIRHSPYREGRGDIVGELAEACRQHGLGFGVYLSPWDRNHADYGRPSYVTYFRNQLRELLTQYGPIFEVWFDGANGGDGYYGGARERRKIGEDYYGWDATHALVRELQPDAVIFSACGPDVRWAGNEVGTAPSPCWPVISGDAEAVRRADYEFLGTGLRHGAHWRPAEADVSIRPGWFYHAAEDAAVKTDAELMRIYLESVGRGAALNLNLPPDRRGRINEVDVAALSAWADRRRRTFAYNLARGAQIRATNTRGGAVLYGPQQLLAGAPDRYWATDDGVTAAEVTFELSQPVGFNLVELREHLPLGCRVDEFAVDAWHEGNWREVTRGTAIGSRCLLPCGEVKTDRVRLRIVRASASPTLAAFGLYRLPPH